MTFNCTWIPFFGDVISREGVQPDPKKLHAPTKMLPPKNKKKLESSLGIMNYLGNFSPSTAEVCECLKEAGITKLGMDIEQHTPKLIWQSQIQHHEKCNHGIL